MKGSLEKLDEKDTPFLETVEFDQLTIASQAGDTTSLTQILTLFFTPCCLPTDIRERKGFGCVSLGLESSLG